MKGYTVGLVHNIHCEKKHVGIRSRQRDAVYGLNLEALVVCTLYQLGWAPWKVDDYTA
jgi:hypothetical protein